MRSAGEIGWEEWCTRSDSNARPIDWYFQPERIIKNEWGMHWVLRYWHSHGKPFPYILFTVSHQMIVLFAEGEAVDSGSRVWFLTP